MASFDARGSASSMIVIVTIMGLAAVSAFMTAMGRVDEPQY